MANKNLNIRKTRFYLLSFFIPILLLTAVLVLLEVAPFGNNTLMITDMRNQYISFLSYFKDVLQGDAGVFYSFSNSLGDEMISLIAYYLLSPFNLLLIFAKDTHLPLFVTGIILLKIGSSGLTMFIYLRSKVEKHFALIGSIMYAMMSYSIVYISNIMWLDGVIFLPLVILGLDQILQGKKSLVYLLFLTLSIVTNYYIGFMVCIFSFLYFMVFLIADRFASNEKVSWKNIFNRLVIFTVESLLAGGIAALLLLPLLYQLTNTIAAGRIDLTDLTTMSTNFNFIDFISKFFIGSFNYNQIRSGLPNIYSTLLILPGFLLFLLNKSIKMKDKVGYIILIGILILSFTFFNLNLVWHAFAEPTWFPYRYSFIFSFLAIVITSLALERSRLIPFNFKKIVPIFSLFLLGLTYLIVRVNFSNFGYIGSNELIISFVFLVIYIILILYLMSDQRKVVMTAILLVGFTSGEALLNSYLVLEEELSKSSADLDTYQNTVNTTNSALNSINNVDESEYHRIEKTYLFNENDPFLNNYQGISTFSSSINTELTAFLGHLGYRNAGSWITYGRGSTMAADSLLGIEYVIDTAGFANPQYQQTNNNYSINENALPIGIKSTNENLPNLEIEGSDPFKNINDMYRSLGIEQDLYREIPEEDFNVELENLESTADDKRVLEKINEDEFGALHVEFSENIENPISFFLSSPSYDQADYYVNGEHEGEIFGQKTHSVRTFLNEENTNTLTIVPRNNKLEYEEDFFYEENTETLNEAINNLKQNSLDIEEFRDGYILGEVNNNDNSEYLFFTIPYDNQWEVRIDDESVEPIQVFDALMAVPLEEGNNLTIELQYKPKRVILGLIISIGSIVISYIYLRKPKNTKDENLIDSL